MFSNYLKTALRLILRNKLTSLINILGLSVGMASAIMIFLYVRYELSFDQYHTHKARIYRMTMEEESSNGMDYNAETPFPLAPALRAQFSGDILITRILFAGKGNVFVGGEGFQEKQLLFAEPEIFRLFDFETMLGNPETAIHDANSVLLTENLANKYFHDRDPLNQVIRLVGVGDLVVKGILKDPPPNSHLPFTMIINLESLTEEFYGINYDSFNMVLGGFITYVLLPSAMDVHNFENQVNAYINNLLVDSGMHNFEREIVLQPLTAIHHDIRYSTFTYHTPLTTILIIALVGVFVLLLACVNYVNLAIVQAIKRSKEVGIRKVVGAERYMLIQQFVGETTLITLLSAVIALIMAEIFLPALNDYLGGGIQLAIYQDPLIIIWVFLASIIIGIVTGLYPALMLSGFQPLNALLNKITSHRKRIKYLKNALVVFQFAIAQLLIIGTLVAASQMDYLTNKDLGFTSKAIINIQVPDHKQCDHLKNELKKNPLIESVTFGIAGPQAILDERFETIMYLENKGRDYARDCDLKTVDLDYQKTFGFEIIAGEWMPNARGSDSLLNVLINKSMSIKLGFDRPEEALGALTNFGHIIGVTEDFHTQSLHHPIIPVVMVYYPRFFGQGYIRVNEHQINKSIDFVQNTWQEVFPDDFFSYRIYDEYIKNMYHNEKRNYDILRLFALITVIIACMGLFGLVSYLVVQKTKEIGIRKVMGAGWGSIISFVTAAHLKLIIIANVIALPLGGYLMSVYLETFVYGIGLQVWMFVVALLVSLLLAGLTIIFQVAKSVRINPAEALKYE